MVSAAASLAFPASNSMKTHKTEAMGMEGGIEPPRDSRVRICAYCRTGFESSKALYGHLRVHRQARLETETERSVEEDEMSDNDPAAVASFVFSVRNYFKTAKKTEVMERGDKAEAPQNSTLQFCRYCNKGFESSKALYGHLRIHGQFRDRSKSVKTQTKLFPQKDEDEDEDEDFGFGCFSCTESFPSMQLLCRHMIIHRQTVPSGVGQPTTMSRESKAKTTAVKQEIESRVCLPKDMPGWSQTGKRGLKRTASDGDMIHDAVPLRVYYRPAHPDMETTKKKTEESMEYQYTSIMEGAADSMAKDWLGRRSTKKAKVMKSVHQCDICGKTFETGQALGGHKSYHREKEPSMVKLVQAKTKQESCVTITSLSEEAHLSDQTHSKKILDFDLNIPYQE